MSITDGLGYPDEGAGTNDQNLVMYCEGIDCGSIIAHDDQYRGVSHGYVDKLAGAAYRYVSPDYFRLVAWEADGLKPVGYGYDSIEAITLSAQRCERGGRRPFRRRGHGPLPRSCWTRSTSAGSWPRRPTARSTSW